jgi:hypothetical protein
MCKRLLLIVMLGLSSAQAQTYDNVNQTKFPYLFTAAYTAATSLSDVDYADQPIAQDYDWSGCSRRAYNVNYPEWGTYDNCGAQCCLVSEHYGLTTDHCGQGVGLVCHFKAPTGEEVTATVTSVVNFPGVRLLYFATAPSSALKRYKVADNDTELYGMGALNVNVGACEMRMVRIYPRDDATSPTTFGFYSSYWTTTPLTSGSGSPAFVPVDGELIALGNLSTPSSGILWAASKASYEASMNGETLTVLTMPDGPGAIQGSASISSGTRTRTRTRGK